MEQNNQIEETKLPVFFYLIFFILVAGVLSFPFLFTASEKSSIAKEEKLLYDRLNSTKKAYDSGDLIACLDYHIIHFSRTSDEIGIDFVEVFNKESKNIHYVENNKLDLMGNNYYQTFKEGKRVMYPMYNCMPFDKNRDYFKKYAFTFSSLSKYYNEERERSIIFLKEKLYR